MWHPRSRLAVSSRRSTATPPASVTIPKLRNRRLEVRVPFSAGLRPRTTPGLGSEMAWVVIIPHVITEGFGAEPQKCKAKRRCPALLENRRYGKACRREG